MPKIITYFYRGQIERGTGNGYEWRNGYSADSADGLPTYPWLTRRECQHDARTQGAIARFENVRYQYLREPHYPGDAPPEQEEPCKST
jgi:hypothetical protein